MKEFLIVLGYTFKENSRKKSFVISTIITLLLTIVIISLPAIIKSFDNNGKNSNVQTNQTKQQEKQGIIFIVDANGLLNGNLNKISNTFSQYEFKPQPSDNIDNLKERVNKEKNTALIVINEKDGIPTFDYFIKKFGSGLEPDAISRALKSIFVKDLLSNARVPDKIVTIAMSDISYNVKELGKGMMNSYISSIMICFLLFFSIYYYGYGVSMSVVSEKTSRVMELLVTSTKPSKIVLGKSAAMGLLGLIQLSMIVITATVTYKLCFPKNFLVAGQQIDFSSFSPFSIFMIIIYFILGYSLYAMMNAVAGATVSKAEDVNSAIMPISMITMIAFYFAYFALVFPSGNVSVVASMIPFSAPFSMPCRLLITEVPAWQIVVSLFSMVITIVFIAWISIKLYSSAVLHYGKRLKIKELLRMSSISN